MKDDTVYLRHIADGIARVGEYTRPGRDAFFGDTMTQDAVIRNLEVIGEAVKRLSARAQSGAPEIPWRQIAGMRDVLIHNYFGVKLDRVWQVVERDLPALSAAVNRLLTGSDSPGGCEPHS